MIYIENECEFKFDFPEWEDVVEKAVQTVMQDKQLPDELDVNVLIVSKESIQEINRDNRGVDRVTDVLSFPYFEFEEPGVFDENEISGFEGEETILGDMIICGEKVAEQALEYGHPQKRELAFLVVHSMLHLSGYDHMEPEDAEIMQAEERRIMDILGITR